MGRSKSIKVINGYRASTCGRGIVNLAPYVKEDSRVNRHGRKYDFDIEAGTVYGELTVVEPLGVSNVGIKYPTQLYGCVCACGQKVAVSTRNLLEGTKACGYCVPYKRVTHVGLSLARNVLRGYKAGALARNHEFSLSDEEFFELIKSDCFYCGLPSGDADHEEFLSLTLPKGRAASHGYGRFNGIDRIVNSKGYTSSNCVPCCKTCNFAKRDSDANEFIKWARRVADKAPCYVF